jgi:putative transposase
LRLPVTINTFKFGALRRPVESCQFTSIDFLAILKKAEIVISMNGKAAWRYNVLVEQLWRSIKYEEIYLHAYQSVPEARAGIGRYLSSYNAISARGY